jgi:hypothetical protein
MSRQKKTTGGNPTFQFNIKPIDNHTTPITNHLSSENGSTGGRRRNLSRRTKSTVGKSHGHRSGVDSDGDLAMGTAPDKRKA